ncbi:MAG: HAD family hydrolase [Thermoplasmatota archaeon]
MKGIKVLGLDLDGTLVNMKLDFSRIRKELGVPIGTDTLAYISSLPRNEGDRLREILYDREREAAENAEIAYGSAELLEYCRKENIKVVIITRNSQDSTEKTLKKLEIKVDMIVSREHAEPKPSPDPIHMVLKYFEAEGHEMILVGDYIYDIQAGIAAGIKTVLITSHDQAGDWASSADYVVNDLSEVLDLLKGKRI